MLNPRNLSTLSFLVTALALVTTGCSDRNIDDYNADQDAQYLVKAKAFDGTYRGHFDPKKPGVSAGTMTMVLEADAKTVYPASGGALQEQAVLQATVTIVSDGQATMTFENGFFDVDAKTFTSTVTVTSSGTTTSSSGSSDTSGSGSGSTTSSSSTDLMITGQLSGSILTGTIGVKGLDQFGADFTLTKDGPDLTKGSPLTTTPSNSAFFQSQPTLVNGVSTLLNLVVLDSTPTEDERFVNYFVPYRTVDATIQLSSDSTPILFQSAVIDDRDNTLVGNAQVTIGSDKIGTNLSCTQSGTGWNCQWTKENFDGDTKNGLLAKLNFTQTDPSTAKPLSPTIATFSETYGQEVDTANDDLHLGLTIAHGGQLTSDQLLQYIFLNDETVTASFRISNELSLSFPATFDHQTNTLTGTETVIDNGVTYTLSLSCASSGTNPAPSEFTSKGWNCQIQSNGGGAPVTAASLAPHDGSFDGSFTPKVFQFEDAKASFTKATAQPVALLISEELPTGSEEFEDVFLSQRTVQASLKFSPDFVVVFENAVWNLKARTIVASNPAYKDPAGNSYDMTLSCQQLTSASTWSCSVNSGAEVIFTATFVPTSGPLAVDSLSWPKDTLIYSGDAQMKFTGTQNINLLIRHQQPTEEDEFQRLFLGLDSVNATVQFSPDFQLDFTGAQINVPTGQLQNAQATYTSGTQVFTFRLDCQQGTPGDRDSDWQCDGTSNQIGNAFSGALRKVNSGTLAGKAPPSQEWYSGIASLQDARSQAMDLTITHDQLTPDQEFFNYFEGTETVGATLRFSSDFQIPFPGSVWDHNANTLVGQGMWKLNDVEYDLTLNCQDTGTQGVHAWGCSCISKQEGIALTSSLAASKGPSTNNANQVGAPENFTGTFVLSSGATYPATLVINHRQQIPDEEFQDTFTSIDTVEATISAGAYVGAEFKAMPIDLKTGTMEGTTNPGSSSGGSGSAGGTGLDITLECSKITVASGKIGWRCKYISDHLGLLSTVDLSPSN